MQLSLTTMQKYDESIYLTIIQNIVMHILSALQADCFSNKKNKEVITWSLCR